MPPGKRRKRQKEGELFEPVFLSARLRNWLDKRISEELTARRWADYSLRPKVEEFALHIYHRDNGPEYVNEIVCDTSYDFNLVESVHITSPEPLPERLRVNTNFVLVKIKMPGVDCPMVIPYLYYLHEALGHNNLMFWRFFNHEHNGPKHILHDMDKLMLPGLHEVKTGTPFVKDRSVLNDGRHKAKFMGKYLEIIDLEADNARTVYVADVNGQVRRGSRF